jgi:hypothetical protein
MNFLSRPDTCLKRLVHLSSFGYIEGLMLWISVTARHVVLYNINVQSVWSGLPRREKTRLTVGPDADRGSYGE